MKKGFALAVTLILVLPLLMVSIPIKAQSGGNIIINADGSVTGTNSIQRNGNIYTLTANISGGIQVQESNIVIDGASFAINNAGIDLTNGVGGNPSNPTIHNLTIRNLIIANGSVVTNGGGNFTFYNDYFSGINLSGSTYCNVTHCTIYAIQMNYGADNNTITENNLSYALAFLSSSTVDRNYWSDYLTKYPNATEIDNTGTGNQPYVYWTVETRTPIIYQDNHPLMKPVTIPLVGLTPTTTPTIPEFPSWIILLFLAIMVVLSGLLVYWFTSRNTRR